MNAEALHRYSFAHDDHTEFEHPSVRRVQAHLLGTEGTYAWCLQCERAFEAASAGLADDAECPYADCGGHPLDFWSWDAYRAFVGGAPTIPERVRVYPLAA
jgi:hypothetical protein